MGLLDELRDTAADRRVQPPNDDAVEKRCPNLWEMITVDKWADGTERVLPTITVSRVSGGYKAVFTDDSLWIRKVCTFGTLEGLADALEAVISSEEPWEPLAKSFRNKKGPPVPEEKKGRRKRS